jgi:pSer/pThr/pTyr-binding forkhead associated (FHA) protein
MIGVQLSVLTRQLLALGNDSFLNRYKGSWLVWEPGATVSQQPQSGIPVITVVPLQAPVRTTPEGDPLCLQLVAPASGHVLRVGRAPDNDFVLNDGTVSREHFTLWLEADEWCITVSLASNATTIVRNMSLQPGERMRLLDGCAIVAGGVNLTFLKQARLLARVVDYAEQLKSGGERPV